MADKPCSCPLAGYCERYGRNMTEREHELCQTRKDYRKVWDNRAKGKSRNREAIEAQEKAKQKRKNKRKEDAGLGDTVARGLAALGITEDTIKKLTKKKTCGCQSRRKLLNKLVPYGPIRNAAKKILKTNKLD